MFQIKICGITSVADAQHAANAGADAIGLNFYSRSPRCLDLAAARSIVAALPSGFAKVGVFVNDELSRIARMADEMRLDFVQLHGDEPPAVLAQLRPRPLIRAFRLDAAGWRPIIEYIAACRNLDVLPAALLIDAHAPGLYGGTGQTVDWLTVRDRPEELAGLPIILAGGLTPENVAEAIAAARPWGVDTASGVESAPGVKDAGKIDGFVREARTALRRS